MGEAEKNSTIEQVILMRCYNGERRKMRKKICTDWPIQGENKKRNYFT